MTRLLYLGFAFPPGVAALFPESQPAGHYIETNLVESVRPWFDIRSVGVSGVEVEMLKLDATSSPGLPHTLNLLDKPPEIVVRRRSLAQLKRDYVRWQQSGWEPELVVVCNLSPIYNAFVRWLRKQRRRPAMVLYLADSTGINVRLSRSRRWRYRLKPMVWLDEEMLKYFDACVAVSRTTEKVFAARNMPWLWLPNGVDPQRALSPAMGPADGPVVFGYFGALAEHSGLPQLLDVLAKSALSNPLRVAGFGKPKESIAQRCKSDSRLSFQGALTPDECLRFAARCDVLVNPRPRVPGNDNNFSSKVFEFALSGRAILTSRLSGVDAVLGEQAFYFDEEKFASSLTAALESVARTPRAELRRRGAAIQKRLLQNFTWAQQGERLAKFLNPLTDDFSQRKVVQ